jgi:hypothetical protein
MSVISAQAEIQVFPLCRLKVFVRVQFLVSAGFPLKICGNDGLLG